MKKTIFFTLSLALLIGAVSAVSYFATKHYIFKQAYSKGYSVASKLTVQKTKKNYSKGFNDGASWQSVKDIASTPRTQSIPAYENPAPAQTSPSLDCTSMTYGVYNQYTRTSCN